MVVDMWRNDNGGLYLEPGEIAVLVDVVGHAVPLGPATHPKALMLSALASALSEMVDGLGVVLTPALPAVVSQACQAYVRLSSDGAVTVIGEGRAGKSARPA